MPHYPKPFFRKSRSTWFVELNGRQINLGRDREEAFKRYHQLLASPKDAPKLDSSLVVVICDNFLDWVKKNRADATYRIYLERLERFAAQYPDLGS